MMSERNIIGARWKRVLNGLRVAGVCCRRSWVRDQRNPLNAEAVMTRTNLRMVKRGREDEEIPCEYEFRFCCDHEDYADCDYCYYSDEFKIWSFQVKEESEY